MRIGLVASIAVISFAATFATTCIPQPVHSREEMTNHCVGYPLPFLCQDLRRYDPATFPEYFGVVFRETSGFAIDVERLLGSWAFLSLLIGALAWLIERAIARSRGVHAT